MRRSLSSRFVNRKNLAELFGNAYDYSTRIKLLRDAEQYIIPGIKIRRELLPEITEKVIEFIAPDFPQYFVQLLNKFHAIYPLFLRLDMGTINRVKLAERFEGLGALIVQASLLFQRELPEPQIFELIETGYSFAEFVESFFANYAIDPDIYASAINAAWNCLEKFHYQINKRWGGLIWNFFLVDFSSR